LRFFFRFFPSGMIKPPPFSFKPLFFGRRLELRPGRSNPLLVANSNFFFTFAFATLCKTGFLPLRPLALVCPFFCCCDLSSNPHGLFPPFLRFSGAGPSLPCWDGGFFPSWHGVAAEIDSPSPHRGVFLPFPRRRSPAPCFFSCSVQKPLFFPPCEKKLPSFSIPEQGEPPFL